jgi:serine phosphatase RsbU (regulator of sigma subunit)
VALGDVAGKGVSAALLMAKLSSDIRFSLLTEPDPGRAISNLNGLLYEFTSPMDRFVTLAVAVLDPARHAVQLVNAGHLPPLLYRPGRGTVEAMPKERVGVPLGILEGFAFAAYPVSLRPGDSLLLFSDGVTDAVNLGQQAFGAQGITAAVQELDPASPHTLGEHIIRGVQQHAAGRAPVDDITLVCLGRKV